MNRRGHVGERLIKPVIREIVVLVVAEVIVYSLFQKADRQMQSGSETSSVHGNFEQGTNRRVGCPIAAQELWCSRKELSQPTVIGMLQGMSELAITSDSKNSRLVEGDVVEAIWHGDEASSQQCTSLRMRVRTPRTRQGHVVVLVLGP